MTGARPRVLVAPDSFEGTFAAPDVALAIARGIEAAGVAVDVCPVADGGEGTMDALVSAVGGDVVYARTHDPLGRPISGRYALLADRRTAVVETAVASGLSLVEPEARDPWNASTYGTGELIRAAVEAGVDTVLIGVGGSATMDGGSGALQALGAEVKHSRLVVLCDVETPWERCAAVYGPQKGADPMLIARIAARLDSQAAALPRDPRGVPRTGAAGGLSGALWATYGARLDAGAQRVLDAVGFDARLAAADVVVCGEGCIDDQSREGKIISAITGRARDVAVPVHALAGSRRLDEAGRRALGLSSITQARTLADLEAAGERLARWLLRHPPTDQFRATTRPEYSG